MLLSTPLRLETPRLIVRPLAREDLADLLVVNGDPEVVRHVPYPVWSGAADAEAWFERMQAMVSAGEAQQLVLAESATGTVIGTLLLFRFDAGSQRAEIGYVLARTHWGRGLMREAIAATCAHLFDSGAVRRFEAEVNPDNTASRELLLSIGFVHEGRRRQRWVAKGATYDVDCFGLLRGELRLQPATRGRP